MHSEVLQVSWKDELGFHQREKQYGNHHQGNLSKYFSSKALDHHDRNKGCHSGQHTKDHGNRDFLSSLDGCLSWMTSPLKMAVNILPRHNGVINHNAQDQDKSKETDDIDGHTQLGHESQSSHEGYRDAQADPKRE